MITRFTDKEKAYKDREYWFKQGYSVGILEPGEGDEFYTLYVDLLERRQCDDKRTHLRAH